YPVADEGYSTDYCYIALPVGAKYIGAEPTITRTTSDGTITLVKSRTASYELDGEEVNVGEVKAYDGSSRVYSTSHNFSGSEYPVLENGLYRCKVAGKYIYPYYYCEGGWNSANVIYLASSTGYGSLQLLDLTPDYVEANYTLNDKTYTLKMWRGRPLMYSSYAYRMYFSHRFAYWVRSVDDTAWLGDAVFDGEGNRNMEWMVAFDPTKDYVSVLDRVENANVYFYKSGDVWLSANGISHSAYFGAFVPSYDVGDLFVEAESTDCSGTATGFISDNPDYSNSQGISLCNNGEYWQWDWGTLSNSKKGTWKAIFRLSGETGSECVISVENITDSTTVSSSTVNPSTLGYHYLDVQFDDNDVGDAIVIRVESTTDYDVNIDYFVMVPLLIGGDGFEDIVNQAHVDPRIRRGVEER
ncbi:hypothetical protein DRN72_04430, partial [Methanosarcinales archaeon]